METNGHTEPLLEAKLELREPDLYYVPSLEPDDPDGLDQLVSALLNDIIGMAALVPRLKNNSVGYAEELEEDLDIRGMKNEIMSNVVTAIEEATEFCNNFEGTTSHETKLKRKFPCFHDSFAVLFYQDTPISGWTIGTR